MRWETRLKQLERWVERTKAARRNETIRVAGRSRSEVFAETLGRVFAGLEARVPGVAGVFVAAAKTNELALDEPREIQLLLSAIRNCDRINRGLPARVLKAVQSGAEAITEKELFPGGRPLDEQGYCYRQGMRFCYPLAIAE